LRGQVENNEVSYRNDFSSNHDMENIIATIARNYSMDKLELLNGGKRNFIARKIAIYFITQHTSCLLQDIGNRFGISYSAVSKAKSDVEKAKQNNGEFAKELEYINSNFKG
jgi:chromosomal replication initiation ATPase DnaA